MHDVDQFKLNLPTRLRAELQKIADDEFRSLSDQVLFILRDYVTRRAVPLRGDLLDQAFNRLGRGEPHGLSDAEIESIADALVIKALRNV